nr:hypothetical protein [Ardenticatena sp.]
MMETLFSHVPFEQHSLESAKLEHFLETLRKRHFTGAVWVHSATNESAIVLFIDGLLLAEFLSPLGVLPCRSTTLEHILSQFRLGHLSVMVQHLPVEALQAVRLLLTSSLETEVDLSTPNDLKKAIRTYTETDGSTVLLLTWSDTDGCLVLTNGQPAPLASVFWKRGTPLTNDDALQAIYTYLTSHPATMTVYRVQQVSAEERDIAISLHTAFAALFNQMLFLYQDFVGSHLATRLTRHLNRLITSKYGWDVRVSTNGIEGGTTFSTAEEACVAYEQLIRDFINLAGIVIGPQLAQLLVRESFQLLPRDLRDTLNTYNLPPLEPLR